MQSLLPGLVGKSLKQKKAVAYKLAVLANQ